LVTKRKRKRKETNKKKPQQAIESQKKAKSKITWRRQVSDPLGKGNDSTHPRQNMLKQRAQTTKPKLEQHKELPLHICKLPLSQSTLPLNQCSNATRESKILLTSPRAVRPPSPGG
jgi:hypothetical protein